MFMKSWDLIPEYTQFSHDDMVKVNVSNVNCTKLSIAAYPSVFTAKPPRYDMIVICAFLCMNFFIGLSIVCDNYCIPAIERICYKMGLSYDVGGCTFMAFFVSSPEFFIQIYSTLLAKDDKGISTILGSSIMNIMAIPALCGLYVRGCVSLHWWSMTRDVVSFMVAVLLLTIVVNDSMVVFYETVIMMVVSIVHITLMFLSDVFRQKWDTCCQYSKLFSRNKVAGVMEEQIHPDIIDTRDPYNFTRVPSGKCWGKFIWILSYPWELMFLFTIPNVRRTVTKNCAPLCLVMSIIWMTILSYLITWMVTVIGFNLSIPDSIMGMTFLAAAASIPEALTSIILIKKGLGFMAIATAISSGTMSILLCLSVPWLIHIIVQEESIDQTVLYFSSTGLTRTSTILLVAAIMLYLSFFCTRFCLGAAIGLICTVFYCSYLIISITIQLNLRSHNPFTYCELQY